jgi:hypothetical protein
VGEAQRTNREEGNAYRLLGKKSRERERKRSLGRPRRMWVDNIKIDFGGIGWGGMGWVGGAQDRDKCRALVNAVMNFRVP